MLIKEYGFWFVQFLKFTYLRLPRYDSYVYKLPRYPTNRMILLELSRQLVAYDKIIRKKKKGGLHFPIVLGNSLEECPTLQVAKEAEDELKFYKLTLHTSGQDFDPRGKSRTVQGQEYKHRVHLEDFWANAGDEAEIRKRMFSRLPLKLIRECEVIQVPNQVEEDARITYPDYESIKNTPIPPVDWVEPEITDLDTLSIPVLTFTRAWVEDRIHRLRRSVALTYDLMGDKRPPVLAKRKRQIALVVEPP